MGELGQFAEGAASWRKVLATVPIESRLIVFENAAADFAGYVARGLDRITAVDELADIATANGLLDDDVVQDILARTFEDIEPEDVVPDLGEEQRPYTNGGGGVHAPIEPPIITPTTYQLPDPANIPRRAWLYGMHYVRGAVTSTVAPGGFGKTTLALYETMEMIATGVRVWFVSGEDDTVELDRRIAAHCKLYNISTLNGLFVDDKLTFPFKIAKQTRNGPQFDHAQLEAFEIAIKTNNIDVVVLDPFVSFHLLVENDTGAMDLLIKRLSDICSRQQCCIELCHHVRKPNAAQSEISVYDARGAAAIVNAVRSCRVLNHMTLDECDQAKVDREKRSSFVRIDNGKSNMTPPGKANWAQLNSVEIANGDKVQAIKPWTFTIIEATDADIEWIRSVLRSGKTYRADSRSPEWLGLELAEHFSRDAKKRGDIIWINQTLKRWERANVLRIIKRMDANRKERAFFELVDVDNVVQFPGIKPPRTEESEESE